MRTSPPPDVTLVAPSTAERALVGVGFPLLGAGAGWLVKAAAGWIAALPWAPFQGPAKLVSSAPEPAATIGALVVGIIAGLVVAGLAERDRVTATIDAERATLVRGESKTTVPRDAVGTVFRDGKHVVLLGHRGQEIARQSGDVSTRALRAAFTAHGYPWAADGDPYCDRYQRWVDGLPGPPPGANDLLRARARALDKGNDHDAAALRTELAGLDVVVRDDDKRQYWRSSQP